MQTIRQDVRDRGVLVSDGAWGTFLQQRGLRAGDCPELWCLERRVVVESIARSYVEAGSDLIGTNSFGASSLKLAHFGLAGRAAELNEAAASISRLAAGPDRHVMGSIGPTGKLLVAGDVSEEQLTAAFREQAVAIEKGGADACCIETFAAIDEACLAIRAARESTGLEIICTFTFARTVQAEYRTMMGVSPSQMAAAVLECGADIIGTNCGNGMDQMIPIVSELRAAAPQAVILVHANAGMPVSVDGVDTFPESPDQMAARAVKVVEAGADIVGGCCGTTPAHIRAVGEAVRGKRSGHSA